MNKIDQLLFDKKDQIELLEQWKNLDAYGLSTKQFCESLIENGTTVTKKIGLKGRDAPAYGKSFTDVLNGWIPELPLYAIHVAEKAGDRQAGLTAAINQLKGGQDIIRKIILALFFPLCLLIGGGYIGIYISNIILATIDEKGIGNTINHFISTYGLTILLLLIYILIAIAFALPRLKGEVRQVLDKLPIFSLYKTATAASILHTIGNLLSCGLKLDDALSEVEKQRSEYVKEHISQMRQQRIGQTNLGMVLDTGLLLPFELSTLKILGRHSEYAPLLLRSAKNHELNVKKRLNRMSKSLYIVGLLVVIAVITSLVGSAYYQILSTVSF